MIRAILVRAILVRAILVKAILVKAILVSLSRVKATPDRATDKPTKNIVQNQNPDRCRGFIGLLFVEMIDG
jgi:hypothetical protein